MAKVWIDGNVHEVDSNKNMLEVCLEAGLDLPYFCWHPALGSVGACRQCAIKQFKDEDDTEGRIAMACMTPASDGTRISVDNAEAREMRANVIEWLMENHPHDCPVCDEGGECHLQDMTVMTGHNYRRYRFKKRTYTNQDLGPFVNHEMNRCIQCYRCVRFYRDHAGGHDLQEFAVHDHVYFGRHEDGVLQSEFSGNLVEVCPTGVFTDKTLKKHYTRKWDLQTAPSVCTHCCLGCNITPGERYGELRRVRGRYNGEVNGYFLCDRGRYGYEFVNGDRRVRQPLLPKGPDQPAEAVDQESALARIAAMLTTSGKPIGIGSPRASLEANFALRQFVGADRFYQGVSAEEHDLVHAMLHALVHGCSRSPSLREVESCDAVLVLGEDVTNTAPMLALALRQSARKEPVSRTGGKGIPPWHARAIHDSIQGATGPIFTATPAATKLDEVARRTFHAVPEDIARLGFAVAHCLDGEAPQVSAMSDELRESAAEIADALAGAERPLVIAGSSCRSKAVIEAAANVAWAVGKRRDEGPAELFFVVPECNSLGLAMLGGEPLDRAFDEVTDGGTNVVFVLENDLYRHEDAASVDAFLEAASHLVVMDCIATDTAARAHVVLPAGSFAESDGTLVNNEGRAQRFFQVFVPEGSIQESWRWVRDAAEASGNATFVEWNRLDDVLQSLSDTLPALRAVLDAAPGADFRLAGRKVARMTQRYSGRTAMDADRTLHEPKPPDDPDSPLAFSMEGSEGTVPSQLTTHFWAPGWNSIQSLNKFQEELNGHLRGGDPGVRLIEPAREGVSYHTHIPEAFSAKSDEWRLIPLYHIFGSEPTSMFSPGVAELAPKPYILLHPEDARAFDVHTGDRVALDLNGNRLTLPVQMAIEMPKGAAGIAVGLPSLPAPRLPRYTRIRKA